uniref:PGG domain-containing protein n=1 Tax=Nelumbo nucifera TaxID=4432 RepID=A0A822XY79_NELNU|nr:TPA_asm: hypothetical protein HUJ06_026436 [Nelumbo nucifera]
MDRTWIDDAAQAGNIELLYESLRRDNNILEKLVNNIRFLGTPLHLSVSMGHTAFSMELAALKPSLTRKLNEDGLSPIHIASRNGNIDIVKGLLRVDGELCQVKGKGMMTPLHCAASAGSVPVLGEFLSACPESIADLTVYDKTALHLALENNQEEILSWKDSDGNTVLHISTSRRQTPMVEYLLDNIEKADVNAVNAEGLTALGVLLRSQRQPDDAVIENTLRRRRASDTGSSQPQPPTSDEVLKSIPKGIRSSWTDYFKFQPGKEAPSDVRNALLVIVALITIATFQAGITPPGGLWQEDSSNPNDSSTVYLERPYTAGTSILATKDRQMFYYFVGCNTIGFLLSLLMLFHLTKEFPARTELVIAMFAMMLTYSGSISFIGPSSPGGYITNVIVEIAEGFWTCFINEDRNCNFNIIINFLFTKKITSIKFLILISYSEVLILIFSD